MEHQNSAGIYLKENKAISVVYKDSKKLSFSLSELAQDQSGQEAVKEKLAVLAENVKKQVSGGKLNMSLDCGFYTQHQIHSKFTDKRQISQTVKFDVEEVLATDIFEKAIAFEINKTESSGSDLTVYAGEKKFLSDVLSDFQTNKLDPMSIEPDVACLARFVDNKLKKLVNDNCVMILLSDERCYIISFVDGAAKPLTRTFLTSPSEDKTKLLQRQITLTCAGYSVGLENLNFLIADTTGSVEVQQLSERLGIKAESFDLSVYLPKLEDEIEVLDAAIAYGCSLSEIGKEENLDFRRDFSPYKGRRETIERTLKYLSVFASIMLLAVGVYFQLEVVKKSKNVQKAETKLYDEVSMIMPKRQLSGTKESVVSLLNREIVKLNEQKSGQLTLEEGSIEAKLNFVLEAINNVPKEVDLNIETIDVSQSSIRVIGDTDSSRSTLIFFDSIKKHTDLIIDERSSKTSGARNNFRVSMRTN